MSKLFSIIALLLLCAVHSMAAANYNELWTKGNAGYQQRQYDSAVYYYEQLAALKPHNAEVYYNLGNAYYRLNKVALAILNYERALNISPDNKDAKDNLAAAQNRINNHIQPAGDIFFIAWWQALTRPANAGIWAIASLISFLLIIACVAIKRFTGKGRIIPLQVPGVLGFICFCLLIPAFFSALNSAKANGAVVMENDAPLMNNQQKGKPLALIPEGTTVKIMDEKGMWIEVSLPDGRRGWILQAQATKI